MIYKLNKNDLNLEEFGVKYGFLNGSIDFNPANPASGSARKEFLNIVSEDYLYEVKQTHGININVLDEKFKENEKNIRNFFDYGDADGVFTGRKGIVLCIRTADCVPVLFACFTGKTVAAVGAVHWGWKGTYGGIVRNALYIMTNRFNINAGSILAVIGPSICKKCYEVKEDFLNLFLKQNNLNIKFFKQNADEGKIFFDLKAYIKNELILNGLSGKNVYDINKCTLENEDFFSYRRNKTDKRQVSFISIAN
ncbi:MAG: peptidoglycan editing factor PgeF [Candidatus Acidulodesulfobacterium acidiphilum]|uniref:Purine nucleoside phosphorylase n=1 Tax=Candidatus Acidulodesulfobacterium acidiphilum TaxID=2597224 RepID=A0A520XEN0_9DELT|nr:MAG: peptidoglycan editing factor PgeF [Candidatus Acidulodesulfobacterium acidiphilum]